MSKKLSRVVLPEYVKQRGTGKAIQRNEAIVYDFMPGILGDQFRTDAILSGMILRPAPEHAPFILETDAYETLGLRYVKEKEIIPAMECYRIALNSRTSFARAIADLQGSALLNPGELEHLADSPLEDKLIASAIRLRKKYSQSAYTAWVEELRTAYKQWRDLNKTAYGSREYIEACLRIGEYKEAILLAKELGDKKLIRAVRAAKPEEILDLKFLKKYIRDNFPESTIGRGDF